ncbi:MAG TPA: ABC transporter substrate-binding protein [Solirubrobacterales bacterium]|nr:ABC transporter substrate-binding protein [Solirubrobacterales bacterium]
MTKRVGFAVLLFAIVGLLVGCGGGSGGSSGGETGSGGGGSSAGGTIKIGFSGDFSSLLAAYDVPLREGLEFAAEQINASGGPYQVELSTADNENKSPLTVSQTQNLLDEGYEINVIGTGSGRTAAATLVNEAGGIALGALNTYPTFPEETGDHTADLVVTDNIQAAASAQYACKQGYKTAYTFASQDFAYSKNLPVYFEQAFEKSCGGKVVGTGQFHLGQTDYSALITTLKGVSPEPEAVYSPMFVPDSVAFVKQLRQAGVTIPYLSSDANYLDEFATSAGSAANGMVASPYAFAGNGSPLEKFQKEYKAKTGKAVSTPLYEAAGRDQVYAVVKAAEMAGSTEPEAILGEFAKLPPSTFVAAENAKIGAATHSIENAEISLVELDDGQFKLAEKILPSFVPPPVR